jgi:hypothetical protein
MIFGRAGPGNVVAPLHQAGMNKQSRSITDYRLPRHGVWQINDFEWFEKLDALRKEMGIENIRIEYLP